MEPGSDFVNQLIQAMLVRSFGGAAEESTIVERWDKIIESRSTVRIRQLWGAIGGSLLCFVGLLFVGLPLVLSGAVATLADAILVGCAAALASIVFWGAVELSMKGQPPPRRAVVVGAGGTLALSVVALSAMHLGDRAEWWHTLSVVVGLCIAGPSALFVYNQLSDLADPGGMRSAFERQIQPLFDRWLQAETAPKIVERPLFPWRHGNREEYVSAQHGKDENTIDVPAQDDLTLADWLEEAARRGISRGEWLKSGKPRYICPTTGERVTRTTYDRMVRMCAKMGYVELGGDGGAAQWLTEPQAAYDDWCSRLEDEWSDALGGGQK
jgi:hypothetical protein